LKVRDFLVAIRFLTIIPLPGAALSPDQTIARSMAYYSLVGLGIGLILVLARHLFAVFLPHTVVAILLVIVLTLLTGALHLDGFSDTIDGLRSGTSREERLRIMRDSRIGAFGVVGLTCLLILKFALLSGISEGLLDRSLVLMATIGRWSMVQVCCFSAYARSDGGLAKPFAEGAGTRELLVTSAVTVAVAVVLLGLKGVVIVGLNALLNQGVKRYFHGKLGGITGDILGATNEVSEVLCLILISIPVPK
jgi:adenosylcobinamide-GDP ribazoletransferase